MSAPVTPTARGAGRAAFHFCVALFLWTPVLPLAAAPGDLDPSLGGTGKVLTAVGELNHSSGVAVQADGKILAVGVVELDDDDDYGEDMLVVRYLPNGALDPGFNGTGKVQTDLHNYNDAAHAVALQSDGKIVVVGRSQDGRPPYGKHGMAVVRYLPDGRPDPDFNGTGRVTVTPGPNSTARAVAIQQDGKIVVAGGSGVNEIGHHSTLLRFLPDGTPDLSFNSSGMVITPFTNIGEFIYSMALQKDGRIVVAGEGRHYSEESAGTNFLFVARYLPDGRPDPDFNDGTGFVLAEVEEGFSAGSCMALQEDGKIVVGGYALGGEPMGIWPALMRFDTHGKRDPAFKGTGGAVYRTTSATNLGNTYGYIYGLTIDRAGRIIATGLTYPFTNSSAAREVVMCVLPDGSLDRSCKGTGFVTTDFGESHSRGVAVALERDGTIVTAGTASSEDSMVSLARYQLFSGGLMVEYPERNLLTHNSTAPVDFGLVTAGSHSREFTVRNPRSTPLTGLTVSMTGHAGEFTFSQPAAATLAPGAATTFVVTFTPSELPGPRHAVVQVAGDGDGQARVFSTPVAGRRATPAEVWRYTWFASPDNSGPGADLNDADRDGMVNLLEYATGNHPHQPAPDAGTLVRNGAAMEFTYRRPAAAVGELDYRPEWAVSPAGPWSASGFISTIISEDSGMQTVRASVPVPAAGAGPAGFVRLRVTRR